jgi:hypothetical protein
MAHKVVLCAAEALLIVRGAYDVSYARRAETFARLQGDGSNTARLVREATRFKLEDTRAVNPDPAALWFAARDFYLATLRECLEVCRGRAFDRWLDVARAHEEPPLRHALRKLKWGLLDRRRHSDVVGAQRKAKIEMAELFLVAAPRPDGPFDRRLVRLALRRLRPYFDGPLGSWEEARAAAVRCDYRYVHPIVG